MDRAWRIDFSRDQPSISTLMATRIFSRLDRERKKKKKKRISVFARPTKGKFRDDLYKYVSLLLKIEIEKENFETMKKICLSSKKKKIKRKKDSGAKEKQKRKIFNYPVTNQRGTCHAGTRCNKSERSRSRGPTPF